MSDQLDNELRKRISEVFDNYEDTAPAEAGWKLLREKFPANKKRRIIPIWWSAAAILLLLCMFGLWFYNQPQKNEQAVVKTNKPVKPIEKPTQLQQAPAQDLNKPAIEQAPTEQQYANTRKEHNFTAPATTFSLPNHVSKEPVIATPITPAHIQEQQQLAVTATPTVSSPLNGLPANTNNALTVAKNNVKPDSIGQTKQSLLAQQSSIAQQKTVIVSKDSVADVKNSKMSIFLANEQKKEAAQKPGADSKVLADKRVLYSVYAATYFNYAEGSKSQMNTGAGFGTDIKLFSNFKLSTGVAIAKNTLNYNGQPTQAGILNEALGVSRSGSQDAQASPSSNTTTLGFVSSRIVADPVVSGYNVSLTGLDVPVNIKYEFNPKKSDSYISAGLSSGTFINETYNYRYDNSINSFSTTPLVSEATTNKSFTRFDFARTLNVSFGMGYQITKSNRLVIEPFLKYPLSGLGSQQIKFGAGGINLRLKFQGGKK